MLRRKRILHDRWRWNEHNMMNETTCHLGCVPTWIFFVSCWRLGLQLAERKTLTEIIAEAKMAPLGFFSLHTFFRCDDGRERRGNSCLNSLQSCVCVCVKRGEKWWTHLWWLGAPKYTHTPGIFLSSSLDLGPFGSCGKRPATWPSFLILPLKGPAQFFSP